MPSNSILLWGAIPSIPMGEPYTLSYQRAGNNFGNLLIGHGVVSVLSGYEYVYRSQLSSPQEANEKCSHIVIPAANFLWKGFDFGYMADFIEATNLPVSIIGLGAQTHDRSRVSQIHPNTLRLVKIISERSPSLGVRGFYTAEVLAAHGILNVEILGCPSLYTMGRPPELNSYSNDIEIKRLVVNLSRRVFSHSFESAALRKLENTVLKLAIENNLPFIAQDELEELSLSDDRENKLACKIITDYFNKIDHEQVINYFSTQTRYFCNVQQWSSFVSKRSGSIGSRLHGNIVSLINGVPALTIAHDSRTLEMCALTGAPYLHVNDFSEKNVSVKDLMRSIYEADYSLFSSNMYTLFERYKMFLEKHKLSNVL